MNAQPLVSVGAINYNNARFVIDTLESIRAQSYSNIELVIVDDCSTDGSVQLIEDWLQSYEKPFKFIKHETNKGVCATCNDVVKNSSGKYLSNIATDDLMMPDKLTNQVAILESSNDEFAAVYSDAYLINDTGKLKFGSFIQQWKNFEFLPEGDIYPILLKGNFLPAMSLLIKLEVFDKIGYFDDQLPFEDYDMWLRLSANYKVKCSDYVSVKYRVRNGSLMFTIKNWDSELLKIYAKHISNNGEAIKMMEDTAHRMYLNPNENVPGVFKPYSLISKKLKTINILNTLSIPPVVGKRIINWFLN